MNISTVEREQLAGDEILGPDGLLAQSLPGYEPRESQVRMANLCDQVIRDGGHALIEAATGTGKSFAYLVPAILSGQRVVISTETIQLQQQLVDKDLKFLAEAMKPVLERPLRYAIAKGRGNYLCQRNAESYYSEYATVDPLGALMAEQCLAEFGDGRWDGDKANLRLSVRDAQWAVLSGDDSCTGRQCPHATTCPYLRAKRDYEEAEVVVTSHAMYLLHHFILQRTAGTVGILPEHAVWIADEAHTVADKAVDTWGIEVQSRTPPAFIKRVLRQGKALGADFGDVDQQGINRVADALFSTFYGAAKDELRLSELPAEVVELAQERMENLVTALKPVRLAVFNAGRNVDPDDTERRGALQRLQDAADQLIDNLRAVFRDEGEAHVNYVELSGNAMGNRDVTLHRKPIETRPIFRRILAHGGEGDDEGLPKLHAAIFTSATLATGSGARAWKPVAEELGLTLSDTRTLQAESPFDYARQVRGYVPSGMPEIRSPEYHTALADEVIAVLNHSQGRAFVLFTSRWDMERVYELVYSQVRFPMLMQGEKPKDQLVREFRETPHSVLFGVKTFWTGVDIPGEALSCVVLAKLPFPNTLHPLTAARCDRIKQRGGSDFMEFSLPRCIRDVKQGFGRLIRSKTDTGLFVILDPRMRTARYGSEIANALPTFRCTGEL